MEINKNHKFKQEKQTGLNLIMVAVKSSSPLAMLLSVKGLWPQLSFVALRNVCLLFQCTSFIFLTPFEIYYFWSPKSVEMAFYSGRSTHQWFHSQVQKSYHVVTSFMIVQWMNLLLWGTLLQLWFTSLLSLALCNEIQFKMWH